MVEQAAAARDAGECDTFASLYTGEKAGRYREVLKVDHGGDAAAFFAGKRRMVVTGPVSIRRQAFATVRVFLVHSTGYKPFHQAAMIFQDDRWQIDSFSPGDLEEPRTAEADSTGVIGLLEQEAAAPPPRRAARHRTLPRSTAIVTTPTVTPDSCPTATIFCIWREV